MVFSELFLTRNVIESLVKLSVFTWVSFFKWFSLCFLNVGDISLSVRSFETTNLVANFVILIIFILSIVILFIFIYLFI